MDNLPPPIDPDEVILDSSPKPPSKVPQLIIYGFVGLLTLSAAGFILWSYTYSSKNSSQPLPTVPPLPTVSIASPSPIPSPYPTLSSSYITISGPKFLSINELATWTINVPDSLKEEAANLEYAADYESGSFDVEQKSITDFQTDTTFTHTFNSSGQYTIHFYARNKSDLKPYNKLLDASKIIRVGLPPEPVVDSLSPNSGPAGTTIVLTGSGFTHAENTIAIVYISNPCGSTTSINNLSSLDSKTLQFQFPSSFNQPDCAGLGSAKSNQPAAKGSYEISVINPNGSSYSKHPQVTFELK